LKRSILLPVIEWRSSRPFPEKRLNCHHVSQQGDGLTFNIEHKPQKKYLRRLRNGYWIIGQ
jgi:hypothetical protein